MGLIYANLDAESDLARPSGRPRVKLPERVVGRLSGFATLLRAFARDGDTLWLPAPVDPARMADVPGLPRPPLVSGRLGEPPDQLLAWAETADVASLRRAAAADPGALQERPLHEPLWHLRPSSPDVVARVHHRGFALELARRLGCALPDARQVGDVAELAAFPRVPWVAKAPLSAAGRDRHLHRGGSLDARARRTLEHLFERHGLLIVEPWMERTDDFGVAALRLPEATRIVGFHRLEVDRRGRFTGLELAARFQGVFGLTPDEECLLTATVEAVGDALGKAGYVGPFGVDAWRWVAPDGERRLHPLGEINARMTFGLVARTLVDRLDLARLGLGDAERLRLVFGRAEAPPDAVLLLTPEAVWLQRA